MPALVDIDLSALLLQKQCEPSRMYLNRRVALGELLGLERFDLTEFRRNLNALVASHYPVPFGRFLVAEMGASLDYLNDLKAMIDPLTARLSSVLATQDEYLVAAVSQNASASGKPSVLAAFSESTDSTVTLDQAQVDRLVRSCAEREGKTVDEALRLAELRCEERSNGASRDLSREVTDAIDVLAHALLLFREPGMKPIVVGRDLQTWLLGYFREVAEHRFLGGAAVNEASVLGALGFPVLVYTPLIGSTDRIASSGRVRPLRFGLDGSAPVPRPLEVAEELCAERHGLSLNLIPDLDGDGNIVGPSIRLGALQARPHSARPDRVMFSLPSPRLQNPKPWRRLRILWPCHSEGEHPLGGRFHDKELSACRIDVNRSSEYDDSDCPWFPLFQRAPRYLSDVQTIVFELASCQELAEAAKATNVVLLGGIEKLTTVCFTTELTEFLQAAFVVQVREFSARGVQIHFELSGSISGDRLTVLRKLLLLAGVRYMSMNRDQLHEITSEFGSEYFVFGRHDHSANAIDVYIRAAQLLRTLRLESLYVHDAQLDMCVLRSDSRGSMAPELLARYRQAMLFAKATVPAAIVARSGVAVSWKMVFSTESLAAFVVFARQYAALVAASGGSHQESIQESMLTSGYCLDPILGVWVVIAPTIYVEFPPAVDLVGAGDMSFAARAVSAVMR